ncbi:DUF3110 domain-containing protein [filamentous cyanobacterium CCP5]|nr:DUF3110 domain-containing protein [filamentous cyanobacterium CCP5]
MGIYVLLFNAGTDSEGIHTLKVNDQNVVLMFENEDDATRFGLMLEAQDFPSPTVEEFDQDEIEEFCQGVNYDCRLVPEGTLAVPPEGRVEQLDWDPDRPSDAQIPDSQSDLAAEAKGLSEADLDRMRRQLEKLL